MALGALVSGCAGGVSLHLPSRKPAPVEAPPGDVPQTAAPIPAAAAHTAEALDTTTKAQRVAATAPAPRPEHELGRSVVALGDPTDPGFWAKTPLVKDPQDGRLVYPETGASVLVELRPLEGASGTQVSLAALRVLGTSLTALPELIIYAR